jgi:hypothetical protein
VCLECILQTEAYQVGVLAPVRAAPVHNRAPCALLHRTMSVPTHKAIFDQLVEDGEVRKRTTVMGCVASCTMPRQTQGTGEQLLKHGSPADACSRSLALP